jgi:AcrR family transcriptional regulator
MSIASLSSGRLRRTLGRPRRLTLRQIVETGAEMGLEDLSVSAVALRLGVGVGTIYTYVENREELVRLVAASLARRPAIEDRGQHWAEIAREQAASIFEMLRGEPALLAHIVAGAIEPDEAFPEMEHFITLLAARGFTPEAAFALYHGGGQIAVGAAVTAAMGHAWKSRGAPRRKVIARNFAEVDAYPHLRGLGAIFAEDSSYFDYRPALERLLAQFAAEQGETLPAPLRDRQAETPTA